MADDIAYLLKIKNYFYILIAIQYNQASNTIQANKKNKIKEIKTEVKNSRNYKELYGPRPRAVSRCVAVWERDRGVRARRHSRGRGQGGPAGKLVRNFPEFPALSAKRRAGMHALTELQDLKLNKDICLRSVFLWIYLWFVFVVVFPLWLQC